MPLKKKKKLPGCIGFIDGTHIEFEFKPSTYGEDYYNYKRAYSLKAIIVCDDNRKITYFNTG
jgi:hypothetical protein